MDDFHKISTDTLEELATFFESFWPDADVDLFENELIVRLSSNCQYVINKHGVTRQIWVASPFSGAHHFHFKNGDWRCTRTDILLKDFLMREHSSHVT